MRKGEVKRMKDRDTEKAQKACEDMARCGERVLGFAMAMLPFSEFPKEFKFIETSDKEKNISFNFPMVRVCSVCVCERVSAGVCAIS